jgi:CheY-like chemotaxis protein
MAKRVLIAEDDPTSRLVLQRVLEKWEYNVTVTSNGTDAWETLQKPDSPRLAILDWMMPGLDGREICHRLRQLNTNTPTYVILLTALGRKEDIVKGLNAGADDYITKPFDTNELRARLDVGRRVVELQATLTRKVEELQSAIAHIKTLQGILPICMHCHKIRNDHDAWQKLENYISEHASVQFTHGLCPECLDKFYPKTGNTRTENKSAGDNNGRNDRDHDDKTDPNVAVDEDAESAGA